MNTAKPSARRGRPPRINREHGDTREALLRAGMEILTEQGFVATGIDTVLKRVQVPKGSFYHYFDSKEPSANRSSSAMPPTSRASSTAGCWTGTKPR